MWERVGVHLPSWTHHSVEAAVSPEFNKSNHEKACPLREPNISWIGEDFVGYEIREFWLSWNLNPIDMPKIVADDLLAQTKRCASSEQNFLDEFEHELNFL